jgi:RNA polymerase sigma factor (sigma-70 family)
MPMEVEFRCAGLWRLVEAIRRGASPPPPRTFRRLRLSHAAVAGVFGSMKLSRHRVVSASGPRHDGESGAAPCLPDEEILDRLHAPDVVTREGAAWHVDRKYGARLYRIALRITNDAAGADDVFSHTFERFYGALAAGRFAASTTIGPWLTTVAYRRALDWVRDRHRDRRRDGIAAELSLDGGGSGEAEDGTGLRALEAEAFEAMVRDGAPSEADRARRLRDVMVLRVYYRATGEPRMLFDMHHLDGLPYDAIAASVLARRTPPVLPAPGDGGAFASALKCEAGRVRKVVQRFRQRVQDEAARRTELLLARAPGRD